MRITIGTRDFKSKRAAADFIREILYRYDVGQTVNGADGAVLLDLLQMHPEVDLKIGAGVASFSVEQNDGSRGFWLTRIDGSRTDWSFLACLTPPTPEAEAKAALRTAIRPQIELFRDRLLEADTDLVCPITGEHLSEGNLDVDHELPFADLVSAFLRARGVELVAIAVKPTVDGSTVTELADPELEFAWRAYHEEHARLRGVSIRANRGLLRRGRR